MGTGSWFPTRQLQSSGKPSSSTPFHERVGRSCAERFLRPDARAGALDGASSLKAGEGAVESLAGEPQLACNVLKRTRQGHGAAAGSGGEIEVEHNSVLCGANLHELQALPQLDD